ncbi:hypothetical protein A1O7_06886 [Cladophialophora yegresii CBS 114405]|uniref:Rhodopsin domain-containing protein n=1 Tax=Cladophialophora yegresii CBS 114405 TaxID=1182544 RepID=W9VLF3_9EURO|nr:uncharacterized protein A1O7_06886 [Cladophialophora yegresii CBS 114405]EXJ56542.1 hypothetical protein A1O7_06886 [Cladophialophora yegresii CBS 114405]
MSATTGSGLVLPPGYSPPFYEVTDTDHTAWIIIATALCLCWLLLFAAIRVFIRCTITPGYGLDDVSVGIATVLAVIQSSLVLGACSDGLGRSVELISPEMLVEVQKSYYTSNIFFTLALGLSKMSVVFFLNRLTVVKTQKMVFHALTAFIATWTVGSTFAVALQCDLPHPWIIVDEKCPGAFLRWKVIGALDIISELAIVLMAIYLVWGLFTTFSKKAIVVGAFAFRLGNIIAICFRLANFDKPERVSNPTLAEAIFIVWTQTELCYSLISATIPSLRPFVTNLNTQFGGMGAADSSSGYASHGDRGGTKYTTKNTFKLSKLRSANRSATTSANRGDTYTDFATRQAPASGLDGRSDLYSYGVWTAPTTAIDGSGHKVGKRNNISALNDENPKADATSVGSNDSQRMIIRKDVTYEVHGV